jgi:hypothetical protein
MRRVAGRYFHVTGLKIVIVLAEKIIAVQANTH